MMFDGLWKWLWCTAVVVVALLNACVDPAAAQVSRQCADAKQIQHGLKDVYGERPVAQMLVRNGSLLQVWSNEDTQTGTVLLVSPAGTGCVIFAGTSFSLTGPANPDPIVEENNMGKRPSLGAPISYIEGEDIWDANN